LLQSGVIFLVSLLLWALIHGNYSIASLAENHKCNHADITLNHSVFYTPLKTLLQILFLGFFVPELGHPTQFPNDSLPDLNLIQQRFPLFNGPMLTV